MPEFVRRHFVHVEYTRAGAVRPCFVLIEVYIPGRGHPVHWRVEAVGQRAAGPVERAGVAVVAGGKQYTDVRR